MAGGYGAAGVQGHAVGRTQVISAAWKQELGALGAKQDADLAVSTVMLPGLQTYWR